MSGPILAQSWLDTKPVYFLSTIHKPHYPPGTAEKNTVVKRRGDARGVDVSCPPLLHDYNTGMGGVDLNDRQRKFYSLGRRSYTWYRRVLFHMLQVTLHNSYILMKRVSSSNFGPLEMRFCLVTQLIGATRSDRHVGRPRSANVDLPSLIGWTWISLSTCKSWLCANSGVILPLIITRESMLESLRKIGQRNLILPSHSLLARNVRWHSA